MKKIFWLLVSALMLAALLSGCGGGDVPAAEGITQIALKGDGAQVTGGGASAKGSVVTISAAGSYRISGTLNNGQIMVDTGDDAMNVILILDNADITNLNGAAIQVEQAENVRIQLAEGSENKVTSGTEADMENLDGSESGAAIYAKDDLDIEGEGTLSVCGFINNGIACKNDLDINGGNISVLAANNGLRGADSVDIKGGTISITAGNDGVKSTTADKEGKGYIAVSGGSLSVSARGDGISAETELEIKGGSIFVSAAGDPAQQSSKAAKAGSILRVSGGSIRLEAADHALHSGGPLELSGGALTAVSLKGKALAAHEDIQISGGSIELEAAESDGMETTGNINISGGSVNIVSAEDGLQAGEANSGLGTVTISGGTADICAGKKAVNARGEFLVSGGRLMALAGADKPEGPDQGAFLVEWLSGYEGEQVSVAFKGEELASISAAGPYSSVLYAALELEPGEGYTVSNGRNQIHTTIR